MDSDTLCSRPVWPATGEPTQGCGDMYVKNIHAKEGTKRPIYSETGILLICLNSFCRKTTLTRHRYRSHSLGRVAASSPGDTTLGQSYEKSDSTSASYDQNLLLQLPYYGLLTTSDSEFNPQQNQQVTNTAAQEVLLSTTIQNVPAMKPFDMQHTQQQYPQMMREQYDQSLPNYMPPGFHAPFSAGLPMVEESYYDSALARVSTGPPIQQGKTFWLG